jgi:hypothetical protein
MAASSFDRRVTFEAASSASIASLPRSAMWKGIVVKSAARSCSLWFALLDVPIVLGRTSRSPTPPRRPTAW